MAKKTIYYYTVSIKNEMNNRDETSNIKTIFDQIFQDNCVVNNEDGVERRSLLLSTGLKQVTMDIIINNENYLFARVGKIKSNSDMQFRDRQTLANYDVLGHEEVRSKGVEICTHFLLDYTIGIVGFIFGQSAPSANILNNIINNYNDERFMCLENIASPESINALCTDGAVLNKINYTFTIPSPEILSYLGLSRTQIDALGDMDTREIQLSIKNEPRKSLSKARDAIGTLIDAFRVDRNNTRNLTFTGKSSVSSAQKYSFDVSNISYSIDIPLDRVENGERVSLIPSELADEVYGKMRDVYTPNRGNLILFSNRAEEN